MPSSTDIAMFFIIFLVGLFGLSCSLISLFLIYKKPELQTAFGVICAAHSIVEAGVLANFVFWSAPLIFSDNSLGLSTIGLIIGFLMNYFYYCSMYIHFIKSFNRLCAIAFSVTYWTSFTKRNATIFVGIILLAALLHMIPFIPYNCNFYYDSTMYTWTFRNPYFCENFEIIFTIDFATGFATMGLSLGCDLTTFCYLKLIKKKTQQKRNHAMSKEIRFYFQACLTTCIYGTSLLILQFLSRQMTSLWGIFATTQLAWQLTHSLNQFVFVIFNYKIEKPVHVTLILTINGPSKTSWMGNKN